MCAATFTALTLRKRGSQPKTDRRFRVRSIGFGSSSVVIWDSYYSRATQEAPYLDAVQAVRRGQIEDRPDRYDARRVDLGVRHVIVALDVVESHGLRDPRNLIEIAQVGPKIRIVHDAP